LIDPPWPIKLISRKARPYQLDMPYKTMTVEEIKNLPIQKLVDPIGCHLFLWTTHKFLPAAFVICNKWGFKYHCLITWDKEKGFTPYSFQWSTEFCLYAQLSGKWLRPKRIGMKALIREKQKEHSAKPRYMHSFIEEYAGDLPRAELFSRTVVKGWDRWGDETISNIDFI
jgi:N6-adenosine-specific RNA methylase IME4